MSVVAYGFGYGAVFHFESFDKSSTDITLAMPPHNSDRQQILLHRRLDITIRHVHLGLHRIGEVLVEDEPDTANLNLILCGAWHHQVLRCDWASVNRVLNIVRIRIRWQVDQKLAIFGDQLSLEKYFGDIHVLQFTVDYSYVGQFSRSKNADIVKTLPGGRVDGCHLDGHYRVHASFYRAADDIIHVAGFGDIFSQHIVSCQDSTTGVQTFFGDSPDTLRHIPLRGAFPHQHIHTITELLHRLFFGSGLMA